MMRNYFSLYQIYSGIHQTVLTNLLVGISAQTRFLILSSKVLTDTGKNIFEKGLDFAPIQDKVNEPELRKDFEKFCRRIRFKWYFRNDI